MDYNILKHNKGKLNDPFVRSTLSKLLKDADAALNLSNLTVVKKSILPASGLKNDYLSRAPYWWPNPKTKSGLPYISKDGKNNPDRLKIKDLSDLIKMSKAIKVLSLAYYYTGEKKYSRKVEDLSRTWFLDRNTRMNPNLNYAQSIPGVADGRIEGIIDTKYLVDVVDGISLIRNAIDPTVYDGLIDWFRKFENWMESSTIGKQGKKLENNIGTAYLMQRVAYLKFIRNDESARDLLKTEVPRLISVQFDIEGEQLFENRRTKSWSYNLANLKYWFNLAQIGENLNLDIWNYTRSGSAVLRKSYINLSKIADGNGAWKSKQITKVDYDGSFSSLRAVGENKYNKIKSSNKNGVSPLILLSEIEM